MNGAHTTGSGRVDSFIARPRVAADMGFWRRLEDRLLDLQRDRPRMARYMAVAYWIANGFLVLGIVLIFVLATGVWSP